MTQAYSGKTTTMFQLILPCTSSLEESKNPLYIAGLISAPELVLTQDCERHTELSSH